MPQAKISSFFKPSPPKTDDPPRLSDQVDAPELQGKVSSETLVTYKRRGSDPIPERDGDCDDMALTHSREMGERSKGLLDLSIKSNSVGILNKKRSYAQYHLEFGQSDFLLHTCSGCGLMYARGDEEDEKLHKAFHKDYFQGVQFKGWRNERVVSRLSSNDDRIVLVLDSDPSAQKYKVNQVVKVMEKELGFTEDRLIHKLCKVYLFISSHRVVGCLVVEPIRTAHRVISNSSSCKSSNDNHSNLVSPKLKVSDNVSSRANQNTLQFGEFYFQREVIKRSTSTNHQKLNDWDCGAILCEEEALPAICGIRAIWVAPSNRRKRIALKLLDAARSSFTDGQMLEASQCAFSPPTSSGKAFASSYSNSEQFLVYTEADV